MKKLFSLLLCLGAVGAINAQKANVDQAAKLSGKLDKISDARTLIKGAISNEETSKQARTYFVAGNIEFDAFDNAIKAMGVNPNDPKANPVDMGQQLINGYELYLQALPLDQLPNEKGKVKPKFTSKIVGKLAGHYDDFFKYGAQLYNAQKVYPEAYKAFMIYGDLPTLEVMGKKAPQVPDSVRATSYFNAGLSAWQGNAVIESAEAFKKARLTGYNDPQAFIYEIACWQNLAQRDSTVSAEAQRRIQEVAQDGYKKFGVSQPIFINNMVNALVSDNKMDEAVALMNQLVSENPSNADILGLRGFVLDRAGNDDASLADYKAAAFMPGVSYETLKNAAKKVFRQGQIKYNDVDPKNAQARLAIRDDYFNVAKQIADIASQLNGVDSDLQYVIDNIDYTLDTYFK